MDISVEELRTLKPASATIINVGRHAGTHEIRGAVRYRPHDLLVPDHLSLPIAQDIPVVLYDEDGHGHDTAKIAEKFTSDGYTVRVLEGGFAAWATADGPTQEASTEQVVPPTRASQVQELDRRI